MSNGKEESFQETARRAAVSILARHYGLTEEEVKSTLLAKSGENEFHRGC